MHKQKSCNDREFKRQQQAEAKWRMHAHGHGGEDAQPLFSLLQSAIQSASGNLNGTNASHVIRTTVLTSNSILLLKVLLVQTRVSLRLAAFSPLYPSPIKDFQQHLNFPFMLSPPFGMRKIWPHPSLLMSSSSTAAALSKQRLTSRCCYTRVKLNG